MLSHAPRHTLRIAELEVVRPYSHVHLVIALLLTLGWTALVAVMNWAYTDPLTGLGWPRCVSSIAAYASLFGGAMYLLLVRRRWRVVAVLLLLISAAFAFPVPSNAGITLRLCNTSPQPRQISIQRDHSARRVIHFTLQPGESRIYKTAPGDWPSSASFTVRAESSEISKPVSDFRRSTVVVSSDSISLQPIQP